MLKKNKKFFIASCIVILLPMFAGFLLWDQLPAQVATHFGRNGEADRYSSKLFAVAGIYLFLLVVHILCSVITEFDPKKRNVGSKIYHLILCICPVVSLWCGVMIYGNALGYKDVINLNLWTNVLLGIVLIVVGNYLPKCRQNYMIGIKLPWTLDNEENWDYTHRMAGMVDHRWSFDDSAWISEICRSDCGSSCNYTDCCTDTDGCFLYLL